MKKILIISFLTITSSLSYANIETRTVGNIPEGQMPTPTSYSLEGREIENDGIGATPINDYAGVLVLTALTIAGYIYHKKEKLSIKNK